jgi:hypothetical protein
VRHDLRSRYGERRSARRLAARHRERISLLAAAIGTTEEQSASLAREALALATHIPRPFEQALVVAFGRLAAQEPGPAAQGRLLVLLVDLEGEAVEAAADLLELPAPRAGEVLASARSGNGTTYVGKACRGWGLASGRRGLSDAEQQAGAGHLSLCRGCRHRAAAMASARQSLHVRATGVAGLLAAGELAVAASSAGAGLGSLVVGKAAIGVIGALGATVLATGGVAAVVHRPAAHPAPTTYVSPSPASLHRRAPLAPRETASTVPAPAATTSGRVPGPALPVLKTPTLPTTAPAPVLPIPRVTIPPLPLPSLPLLPHGLG